MQLHFLPIDILFIIMNYINDPKHFLQYIKIGNESKYKYMIRSINNKINYKYKILENIGNIYLNIEAINTKVNYMMYKNQLFNNNNLITTQTSIICYKLLELYEHKLEGKQKRIFNNICNFLKHQYIKECVDNIKEFTPKIQIKNNHFDLDLYLTIKNELL
jgi:hypothetical protein